MAPDPLSPYPPSGYGPPPSPGGSPDDATLGWAGVASAVASWLLCCCTPIPFVGLLANLFATAFAIAGMVCGAIAYRRARATGGRTDLALIGLVLGGARFGLMVLAVVILLVVVAMVGVAGMTEYARNLGH